MELVQVHPGITQLMSVVDYEKIEKAAPLAVADYSLQALPQFTDESVRAEVAKILEQHRTIWRAVEEMRCVVAAPTARGAYRRLLVG